MSKIIPVLKNYAPPVLAITLFLIAWSFGSKQIETSLGQVPGPAMVLDQARVLWQEHVTEREKAKAFYERQKERRAAMLDVDPTATVAAISYTGKPTYVDQILTSLKTVFMGFLIASLVALPIGVICGLSKTVMRALNPLIQVFKPVSPLAWLPIVTLVVSAVYVTNSAWLPKSFLISAITVSLCSLWATLINTAMGVASVNP